MWIPSPGAPLSCITMCNDFLKTRSAAIRRSNSAFTMVEIAICLAIIGIALVAIIGVLPIGMHSQQDTREETVINEDAATLLPMIAHGLTGNDDLTNYIYAITNYVTLYDANGSVVKATTTCGYSYSGTSASIGVAPFCSPVFLTNGANIVGLLRTPEYIAVTNNYPAVPLLTNNAYLYPVYSNHVVAYVHSISGLVSSKPPQDNQLMQSDSFSYKVYVVNSGVGLDSSSYDAPSNQQLWNNQHEVRLSFYYPLQPNGNVGPYSLSFRATVAGQLAPQFANGQLLYFYQPGTFEVNTNL